MSSNYNLPETFYILDPGWIDHLATLIFYQTLFYEKKRKKKKSKLITLVFWSLSVAGGWYLEVAASLSLSISLSLICKLYYINLSFSRSQSSFNHYPPPFFPQSFSNNQALNSPL